jgi:tetratricopeptide (TPR) repeat protein
MGSVLMSRHDLAGAEAEFQKQLEVTPDNSNVYILVAEMRARQGNAAGAVQIFRQGLEALPGNKVIMWNLATHYQRAGDLDQAAETYQQGFTGESGEEHFGLGLAGIRESQKRFDDAIAIYENIIAKNPANMMAVNNLAVLLSERRADEQSKKRALELALGLADSEEPAMRDTLGWIYYQTGDYDKAAQLLSGVVEAAPTVGVFRYHLGMTYYKQGDFRAASKILSEAVAKEEKYDGVEEARRVYAEIRDK